MAEDLILNISLLFRLKILLKCGIILNDTGVLE